MEYTWHMDNTGEQESSVRPSNRTQSRNQGPGFIEDLDFEAYMGPVNEGCFPPQIETRRNGGHQLPESPPDSGSENPYSPSETQVAHAITVPQSVLNQEYMLVHDHIPTHDILQQNGNYIYEELKGDNLDQTILRNNLENVIVLPQEPGIVELGIRQVRHDIGIGEPYQNRYTQMRVDMPELDQGIMNSQLVTLGHETLTPVYTNVQEPSGKKRKHSQDVNSQVKCEPAALSPESVPHAIRAPPSVDGSEAGDDTALQCIRFAPFLQTALHILYDSNLKPLQPPTYVVGADKGFNYSQIDEAFVCQKKNHFQVTCQIQIQGDPHYVKTADGFKKIDNFCIHFYGVKAEDPSQEVRVEQSQSDRTKKPFHPVPVEIRREGAKVTVGRLHFAETTNNNMRKKGRPNPDQRHFQLVVALRAHVARSDYMVVAHASDRIIVRASNPGQFESDCTESWWQRGVSENSVHFSGKVGINTDRPDESCVVNGNLKVMGHILHPSDVRAKHNIEELDTAQQLRNVQSIRVVKFKYDRSFAEHSGLLGYDPGRPSPALDTGVIAQEVRRVLPEAVREAGDLALPNGDTIPNFLVVNKDRIFMENLGAVKELCKVTGHLESRIDQLEKINKKLCKISVLQRRDSSRSSVSNDSRYSITSNSSKSLYSDNISIDQIRDIARSIRKHECCHKMNHNSPKYTRKQCKNCHGNYTKFGKYYNYNKTSVRYHSNKPEKAGNIENPTYVDAKKLPDAKINTASKKQDTCVWLRNGERFSYGNTKLGFCCRRDYGDASSELISNKFLQIVITILIFIMAVCLVVMSALYFREHQELMSMKEIRMHEKITNYPHYGKPNGAQAHRSPTDQNQIQNLKSSQQIKKPVKDKGPHKTTQEYTTSVPTETPHTVPTTLHPAKNFFSNIINTVQTSSPQTERPVLTTRQSDIIGDNCVPIVSNNNNELDPECQSSCGLDTPQTYENQEPLEGSKPDKELNDTFIRPLEPQQRERLPNIPAIPDKNNSETLKFKNHGDIAPESNFLEASKQNVTETVGGRFRRDWRWKRETDDEVRGSFKEINLNDQSSETVKDECDTVRVGIASKSVTNISLFAESICTNGAYNFSYTIPLSHCLTHKNIEITFKSSKLKEFRVCNVQCRYDDLSKACLQNWETPKLSPTGDLWGVKMPLDCNMDKVMRVRSRFVLLKPHYPSRDLCHRTEEYVTPFVEFNIRLTLIDTVQTSSPQTERPVLTTRQSDIIGDNCVPVVSNNNNELDPECQSSCGLDTPQTYENQEPLEGSKPDKELNDTFIRPLEPQQRERLPNIPAIPDKNNSETLKFKNHGDIAPESNFLEASKQNVTETVGGRFRRDWRWKRETDDEVRGSFKEINLNDQSSETVKDECDTVRVGIASKSVTNISLFAESICTNGAYNFSYTILLSHCLTHKNIEITFKSSKLKEFRVCNVQCRYDDLSKACLQNWETPKLSPTGDLWGVKMPLDCNMDKVMRVRSRFVLLKPHYPSRDLCHRTEEYVTPFVEFNIRIYRKCHN